MQQHNNNDQTSTNNHYSFVGKNSRHKTPNKKMQKNENTNKTKKQTNKTKKQEKTSNHISFFTNQQEKETTQTLSFQEKQNPMGSFLSFPQTNTCSPNVLNQFLLFLSISKTKTLISLAIGPLLSSPHAIGQPSFYLKIGI